MWFLNEIPNRELLNNDSFNSTFTVLLNKDLDRTTFEAIYRAYWLRLYDFALAKVHDVDVAEEIVQDMFVVLWERRFDLQVSNLPSYLFVAVRNRVIDHYKQRLFLDLETLDEAVAPDYPLFLDELEAELNDAVDRLPLKTREIFMLNRLEGQSADEISAALDIPKRTVEYHITQALRQLKVLFRTVNAFLFL